MSKRLKRAAYRSLTKIFGSPLEMSAERKREVFILLGGWIGQRKGRNSRNPLASVLTTRWHPPHVPAKSKEWLNDRSVAARGSFGYPKVAYWKIETGLVLKDRSSLKGILNNVVATWQSISSPQHKSILIGIAGDYDKTVAKHEVRRDGRKIVQKIWDYRSYGDKEVWRCYFWDMSKLSSDTNSWTKCTQHEGYVVKTQTNVAVGVDLYRTMRIVMNRTAQGVISHVLSDTEEEQ